MHRTREEWEEIFREFSTEFRFDNWEEHRSLATDISSALDAMDEKIHDRKNAEFWKRGQGKVTWGNWRRLKSLKEDAEELLKEAKRVHGASNLGQAKEVIEEFLEDIEELDVEKMDNREMEKVKKNAQNSRLKSTSLNCPECDANVNLVVEDRYGKDSDWLIETLSDEGSCGSFIVKEYECEDGHTFWRGN
jgi:uncharacterized protein YaaR (DUF327 family)